MPSARLRYLVLPPSLCSTSLCPPASAYQPLASTDGLFARSVDVSPSGEPLGRYACEGASRNEITGAVLVPESVQLLSLPDTMWLMFVTMTTVGYGDCAQPAPDASPCMLLGPPLKGLPPYSAWASGCVPARAAVCASA